MAGQVITYGRFVSAFERLEIDGSPPVIAHASFTSFGRVNGGVDTLLGALTTVFDVIIMPAFTYHTMLIPEAGPPDNAMDYGTGTESNLAASYYRDDLPADLRMGVLSEALRRHPDARRSHHPILSFAGFNARWALEKQSLDDPLAPIRALMEADGWVLLMGVDHRANTSIHLAEQLAGRKQFIRWALTPAGVVECRNFPGCSYGFNAINSRIRAVTKRVKIGKAWVQALPLHSLVEAVLDWIEVEPRALLCSRSDCQRCRTVSASLENRDPKIPEVSG